MPEAARHRRLLVRRGAAPTVPPRGIVLIGVLWLIALLSIIAACMAINLRSEARLAGNLVAAAQARHAADGGVQLALAQLLARGEEAASRTAIESYEFSVGAAVVHVVVASENGKIDLNVAPEGLLDALLQSSAVPAAQRRALVDAILDWRDSDGTARPAGAEDADYAAASRVYGSKDGPFDSVDELQLVLGMTPALYHAIRPALTIHSRAGRVNLDAAPVQVVQALLAGANADAEQYLLERLDTAQSNRPARPSPVTGIPYAGGAIGTVYSVQSRARLGDGATAQSNVTVDVRSRNREEPLRFRDWRRDGLTPKVALASLLQEGQR